MASRPVLRFGGGTLEENKKRGEEAKQRVLTGQSQQQKTRPTLEYVGGPTAAERQEEMEKQTADKRLQVQESRLNQLQKQTVPQPLPDSRMLATSTPNPAQSIREFQSTLPKVEPKLETGIPLIDNVVDWYDDNVRNTFVGKAIAGAEKADRAVSDFKAGAMDTATFGITQGIGRAAINSLPGGKENLQPIMDGRIDSTSYKVGEFAGYVAPGAAIERGVAGVLRPVLKNANPILRGATTAGIAGLAEGTVQEMGDDLFRNESFDKSSVLLSGAAGGALGGAMPLIGRGIQSVLNRWKPKQQVEIAGALPLGRRDAAAARGVNAPGTEAISPEYTFKLPEGNPNQQTNVSQARNDLKVIDEEIRQLNQQYEKAVVDEYHFLKISLDNRGGVTQGGLIKNEGEVVGRFGRQSNNPRWYREFYAQNGRVPNNKELYQLAKQRVDNGFADDAAEVPSWKAQNNYDETVTSLEMVRNQISNSLRELDPAIHVTDTPLVSSELRKNTADQAATPAPQQAVETQRPKLTYQETVQTLAAPQTPVVNPKPPVGNETPRGFATTLLESEKPPAPFKERLQSAYRPTPNQETLNIANKRIGKDVEEATSYVLGNSRFTAEKATVAQRLIDHYNGQGNYQRAVDIAQKVSEEATRAGQSIQALSMFNRLTPQGVLIHAQRIAKKTNESIPLGAKEVKVTPEMAADITTLAQASQKMTGVNDLSNDVMSILDKAKSGAKLTETETQLLKRFIDESRQFVKEVSSKPKAPRTPRQPKDKRVRQQVVSFLDAQEQAAKERLRAKGIRVSSTPLDVWADYAIIGAAKMGKRTIKFADWSEQIVKDLGEDIRPNLGKLYQRSREVYEASAKKVSQQTVDKAEKLTEKVIRSKDLDKLRPEEAQSLRQLARTVSELSGQQKQIASQDLQVILQALEKPSFLKRVSSVQTMGQLLNPKTQVRNALGNELFYRLERLNKLIATPIDIARSTITRGERTVTFRTHNQGKYWANWMRGLKAGWKGVNVNGIETQYDLGSPAFKSKYNPLTYFERALGAALKSFDTAAYMRAYNNTIGELATLRAMNEGRRGDKALIQQYIREADDNVLKIADEYGKYVTMQDNNLVSRGLVALKRGMNFKQDWGMGDLILKYPKTPGNLLMRALEYSPAGFVRSAAILARPIFKKEPNTAEMTQALSRAIVGTLGLSGMGYFLLDKGILTGAASKDKDIRELQKSAGQGQYQVNLSALIRLVNNNFDPEAAKIKEDDFLYTYDWMQPISIAISIGANVQKNNQNGDSKLTGLAGTAYNSLEGGLGTLTEQSVLSGLKSAAQGYPGQTVTDKIMDVLSDIPSSFVPTVSNQINQIRDNTKRETYSPNKFEQSLNKAKAKIPGLAQDLPQQYSTLGEGKTAYQDNNIFNVMFNPGFSSRYKLSPEAEFIVDLINESGDESLAPRAPSKSITIDGQSIKLTGDMYSRFQQLQGEETRERIAKLSPTSPLKTRVSKTEKALNKAGESARKQINKELGQ